MSSKLLLGIYFIITFNISYVSSSIPLKSQHTASPISIQIFATFFKDTRTLHSYDNEPKGREFYVKFIHDLNMFSLQASTFDEGFQKDIPESNRRYSKTDGYILYMTKHDQYLKFLKFVQQINPLAKVMIFSSIGSIHSAQNWIIDAWNRFNLMNVIYFVHTVEGNYWFLYNPFEKKLYNLAEVAMLETFLTEYLSCKDVCGFPMKIVKPTKLAANSIRNVGLKLLNVAQKKLNFSAKYTEIDHLRYRNEQHFGPPPFDIDSHPTTIRSLDNDEIFFMRPLYMLEIVAVVPKNYYLKLIDKRYLHEETWIWYTRYVVLFVLYSSILFIISKACQRKSDSEMEITNLLLSAMGCALCFTIARFKIKHLQFAITLMMFPAMLMSNMFGTALYDLFNFTPNCDINTLSELVSSDLRIIADHKTSKVLKKLTEESTVQKLIDRIEITKSKEDSKNSIAQNYKTALLYPQFPAAIMVQSTYDSAGHDLFHIVPEPVYSFYSAMVGRRNCPLLWKIDELTARMIEAGIVQHERGALYFGVQLERLARVRRGQLWEPEMRAISFRDFWHLLSRMVQCFMICILVWILEILHHKYGLKITRCVNLLGRYYLTRGRIVFYWFNYILQEVSKKMDKIFN